MIHVRTIHKLFLDNGLPVGARIERGDPLPTYRFDYETLEEAEKARLQLESYLTSHQPKIKRRKK